MEKFVIRGGITPKGTIKIMGAKNVAFPILAATLLTKEPCFIDNIPLIEDVYRMIEILEGLGAEVSWVEKRKIMVKCENIDPLKISREIVVRFRGSILILGALLARFKEIDFPSPGGCLIGARPIDTHLDAFRQLGFEISVSGKNYSFARSKDFKPEEQEVISVSKLENKSAAEVIFKEISVTATENILLFSSLCENNTVLRLADTDYQVGELVKVLRIMGVEVSGGETHMLSMTGKKELKGFEYTIISDPIETGTFVAMALATGGDVTIENAELSHLTLFLKRLKDFGARFEILSKDSIRVKPSKSMKMDKIQSLPYPGIHTDLQPELGVLATQAIGPTLIHDPLYEGRLKYLEELNKMGANIIYCDPHRAIVIGPTKLFGIKIPSPDLRAGAALIIAGLVAEGETIIDNIYQIDRGYEKIEERLAELGLDIKRIKE